MSALAVGDLGVYKGTSITQRSSTSGFALIDTDGIDVDTLTGVNAVSIDLSDNTDAGFYAVGSFYTVILGPVTIDAQTVYTVLATFRIVAAEVSAGTPVVDVGRWLGTAAATPTVAGVPEVDVTHWIGTAAATPTVAGVPEVDLTHIAGSVVSTSTAQLGVNAVQAGATAWNSGAIQTGTFTAGAINAAAIAADAIGASELAADAVAEIADAVWDEVAAGHLTLGTYGQIMRALGLTGEVNDVASTTTAFVVDGFTEATNDHFNGMIMVFTSGANAGEARVITDYTGATQTMAFGQAWTDAPADNDDFVIVSGTELGGTLAQVFRLFLTLLSASGEIQATTLATAAITAAKFAAGAIDAAALAADAGTEIAAAVWNEDATAHQTLGTFGQAIGDPVADANTIFGAVVTGATGATIAADIITIDDFLDTEVAAIKAVTDQFAFGTANRVNAQVYGMEANAMTAAAAAADLTTELQSGLATAASISALNNLSAAQVNTEVLDVLNVDTFAEPAQGAPAATASLAAKIGWLFKTLRNRSTQTSSQYRLYNDDAVTVDTKATFSDDGTTADRGELTSGP